MYAAGKIPGGFIKREARASEAATLAARLTDRPIRPLFPEGYKDDIQLVITVLSTDQENEPDVLGTVAASAALTISEIPFAGPVGAVRIGRIDGEFVVNPTYSQLEESELDLIVSGTRDAIMMVEAGAKLLPEDVMAEAILFGHRALQPLIDIQEELQKAVGKTKSTPFLEAGTDSVLDFAKPADAGDEFVIVDVETTGTDPKMADLVEIAAVKVKGGKITDRWSTLVNPGRPIVGNQMHGITDADVKKAPEPGRRREAGPRRSSATRTIVGHSVGFDLGFLEAALADGTHFEPGRYLDTLTIAREGYPDLENYKLPTLSNFFGIELAQAHRALPDAEATANLLIWFGNDLPARIAALKTGIADSFRANRTGGDSKALQEAARREARVSKSLFNLDPQEDRPPARPRRGHPDGRPRRRPSSARSRSRSGSCPRAHGSGLFTRGETQVLTIATLGVVLGRPAHRHDQPQDREALHPPLQLPALLHGREQADARPQPPRHRARQPGRAGAHPGPAEPRRVPVRHPARVGVHVVERLDVDGLDLRLDPRPDGRRRADHGPGRRRGDGPDQRAGRPVRRPDRHPRQGGLGRRHGLQGDRHAGRHHRPADGHQGPGHQRGDHPRRPQAGPRGPPRDPRQDDRGHARGPRPR